MAPHSPDTSCSTPVLSSLGEGHEVRTGWFVPIGVKFASATLLVVGGAATVAFFQASERERLGLIQAKRVAASMVVDLLAQSLEAPLDFADEDAARAELEHLRQNRDITHAAVWRVAGSEPWLAWTADAFPAMTYDGPTDFASATIISTDRIDVRRPVLARGHKLLGSIHLRFSLANDNAAFQVNQRRILLYSIVLALGTAGLLIAITRSQIVGPVQELVSLARGVERGERVRRRVAVQHDEIGRLAQAFGAMEVAIFERESKLSAANASLRELFDHMRQAIIVFDAAGRRTGPMSRVAQALFGAKLDEVKVGELLYGETAAWEAERRAFDEWVALAFEAGEEHWAEVAELAPRRVVLGGEQQAQRELSLEFRPIAHEGRVAKIMLLATDETERVRLEREIARQGAKHETELAIMRRLLAGNGQSFVDFLQRSRRRLELARDRLSATVASEGAVLVAELFRIAHTMRAEALAFEMRQLHQVLTKVEDHLAELRQQGRGARDIGPEPRTALASGFAEALGLVADTEELCVQASPLGRDVLEAVTVSRADVESLVELCAGRGDELQAVAERLASRPFGACVAEIADQAAHWAERQSKRVSIVVEGGEVRVPPALAGIVAGVVSHLVRNAIAHGIEPVSQRVAVGKGASGAILIGCYSDVARGVRVVVDDDGRGVAHHARLRAASQSGRPLESADLAPVSTVAAADDLSGRKVGLSAIQVDLAGIGYACWVAERASGGTHFEIRPAEEQAA